MKKTRFIKKQILEKLKEDEEKYKEYRLKINEYNKKYRLKKKENLINSVAAI